MSFVEREQFIQNPISWLDSTRFRNDIEVYSSGNEGRLEKLRLSEYRIKLA